MEAPVFLILLLVQAALSCPSGEICCSNEEINACMAPLIPYTNDLDLTNARAGINPLVVMSAVDSLDKTEQLCAENKIQNAFACLNKMYNLCASTREGAARMDMLVDVGKWREAMDLICNNTDYLREHAACEEKSKMEFLMCIEEPYQQVASQMMALHRERMPAAQKTEVIRHIGCSFTGDITNCLTESYHRHCPDRFVTLLLELVKRVMPPNCLHQVFSRVNPGYILDDTHDDVNPHSNDEDNDSFERKDIVVDKIKPKVDRDESDEKDMKDQRKQEESDIKIIDEDAGVDKDDTEQGANKASVGASQSGGSSGNSGSRPDVTLTFMIISSLLLGCPGVVTQALT